MVRPPLPADATTACRFDICHSNLTHDVHDTLSVGPSLETTDCQTWIDCVYIYSGLLHTFLIPLALKDSRSACFTFLFYLAIGHGTTPLPLLAVAYLYIATLAGLSQGNDQSRSLSMQ